ncbi:App1-like protein [Elsinoe fawcettii]|nr:App1-like protein [Elsinoe fawcettii]
MATLNLSTNGPSIKASYQKVVDSPAPSGSAASSPTYGQWAVFTVQAPLVSAFQNDSSKESVLKVQTTGEGELIDLIEEFSEGRIQFAFVKVKDSNSGLPKSVLIAWCGEGVPERTKGYFTSHLTAVSKLLHGYHVQVTARSDRDLTPESIIQKVADASGAKYTGGAATLDSGDKPAPPLASKPVFTPNKVSGAGGFAALGSRSRAAPTANADGDGWGEDAPQVTRSQLEKVESAYKPTKVNMAELTSQKQAPSRFEAPASSNGNPDVVRGGYQPIGKVDIAAIRRQAKEQGSAQDDRPTTVKGAYEPIGKVDIAAIRAKAQGAPQSVSSPPQPQRGEDEERPKSLADRSSAFQQQDRLTSLPKPKVANKFGGANSFTGTKAPSPGGFTAKSVPSAAPVGTASKTFADQGGKTPAQLWAEKKARERGTSGTGDALPSAASATSPVAAQKSGGWQSGYTGKKWGDVQTTKTGNSHVSADAEPEQEREETEPSGGFGSIKDRFQEAPPILDTSSKPNAGARGVPMPGLPARTPSTNDRPDEEHVDVPPPPAQPRSPSPPVPSGSPVRIAMPVSRTEQPDEIESSELPSIPGGPIAAAARATSPEPEPQQQDDDDARGASQAAAATTFGTNAGADAGSSVGGKRALIQYDYEKAEDNEIELVEGQYVTNIEMVDEDWWMGQNSKGETGLFPSNYVELVDDDAAGPEPVQSQESAAAPPAGPASGSKSGPTATAQYDYEAAEDNEISFPEGAKITEVEFPDEDWWLGVYNGKQGLFPSNYVQLDQ